MAGRTFRIFVSSTFSDMKEERNALVRWVFPRLRELCASRGYEFQAVDLRWGVRDEAGLDQQTVRICLDEIGRCQQLSPRPNFIVLLGDRYGWRPAPSAVPAEEMGKLRPYFTAEELALFFGDQAAPSSRQGWYRRDDNAVPAEYVLRPRRGPFEKYEVWEPVERRLRETLASAARRAGLEQGVCRKYRASATELEIVKGALEVDAEEHVFAFFRAITNLDEVRKALPSSAAIELVDTLPDGTWDKDAWAAQMQLKASLTARLGKDNVWPYQVRWENGTCRLDLSRALAEPNISAAEDTAPPETASLCEAVWQRVSRVLVAEMAKLDRQDRDPLEVEKRAHAEFAEKRRRTFAGRQDALARIAAYLSCGQARPLVVYGPSGSGKSALMARAVADASAALPGAIVVERFIGGAPGASDAHALLSSLCRELSRRLDGDDRTIPTTYEKLIDDFAQRLALARSERPIFVFLDALDQLGDVDAGRRLAWLPRTLPPNVRLIVSTLPEQKFDCFSELLARSQAGDLVEVTPMGTEVGETLLASWLSAPGVARTLTDQQRALILDKFQTNGLPLYLRLCFEEARGWHSYDSAPGGDYPDSVAGIMQRLFSRLSTPEHHGPIVVSRAVGFLAAARHGLAESEMLDLLWRDSDVRADFSARKHHDIPAEDPGLPPVVWSRLYVALEPYLAQRELFGGRLLTFYHRELAEVAEKLFLAGSQRREAIHSHLAGYCVERWKGDDHALSELVFQSAEGRCIAAVGAILDDVVPEMSRRLGIVAARQGSFLALKCLATAGDQWAAMMRAASHFSQLNSKVLESGDSLVDLAKRDPQVLVDAVHGGTPRVRAGASLVLMLQGHFQEAGQLRSFAEAGKVDDWEFTSFQGAVEAAVAGESTFTPAGAPEPSAKQLGLPRHLDMALRFCSMVSLESFAVVLMALAGFGWFLGPGVLQGEAPDKLHAALCLVALLVSLLGWQVVRERVARACLAQLSAPHRAGTTEPLHLLWSASAIVHIASRVSALATGSRGLQETLADLAVRELGSLAPADAARVLGLMAKGELSLALQRVGRIWKPTRDELAAVLVELKRFGTLPEPWAMFALQALQARLHVDRQLLEVTWARTEGRVDTDACVRALLMLPRHELSHLIGRRTLGEHYLSIGRNPDRHGSRRLRFPVRATEVVACAALAGVAGVWMLPLVQQGSTAWFGALGMLLATCWVVSVVPVACNWTPDASGSESRREYYDHDLSTSRNMDLDTLTEHVRARLRSRPVESENRSVREALHAVELLRGVSSTEQLRALGAPALEELADRNLLDGRADVVLSASRAVGLFEAVRCLGAGPALQVSQTELRRVLASVLPISLVPSVVTRLLLGAAGIGLLWFPLGFAHWGTHWQLLLVLGTGIASVVETHLRPTVASSTRWALRLVPGVALMLWMGFGFGGGGLGWLQGFLSGLTLWCSAEFVVRAVSRSVLSKWRRGGGIFPRRRDLWRQRFLAVAMFLAGSLGLGLWLTGMVWCFSKAGSASLNGP